MSIEKVTVIGAGVMGAGIAAHIANAGVAVDLLDVLPKDDPNRNAIAENAIAKLLKTDPAAFMHPKNARLVTPGNTEDHLERVAQADWVIEAIIEHPGIKQALYQKLHALCKPTTLISSNTSTLPLSVLTQGLPEDFKHRFMITHFFNPPRYMRLLELVAPTELAPDLLNTVTRFADVRLGKGCVTCHDTPGFIANRIGTFWIQSALLQAIELNLSVEQCDAAMALFGIPKTGVFGLLDLVGLDLMPHILQSFSHSLPADDRMCQIASIPPLLSNMIAQGLTGRKGLGGFYRLQPDTSPKIKQSINLHTGEYHVSEKFVIDGIAHKAEDLRRFLSDTAPLSRFALRVWLDTLSYTAGLLPGCADDIVAIDTAMRLGYNWRYGPFELLDRLGVEWLVAQLAQAQQPIPALLADRQPMYSLQHSELHYKDLNKQYQPLPRAAGIVHLRDIKLKSTPLLSNVSASLWDIGDGIVCLEFHSKMNTLDLEIMDLIQKSIALVQQQYQGMVIYNEADNFSAGANLTLLVPALLQQQWQQVTHILSLGQQTFQALKQAHFPVVGAPTGLALGGGCEILLHCDAIQAHAELYMGLVETGVGLVPGWGGCKELLRRWQALPKRPGGPMPFIAQAFETIGLAKVSKSAQDARELLYLSANDNISMNRDRLLADAKARALAMVTEYKVPEATSYYLPGASAAAAMDLAVQQMHKAGKATAYDVEISRQLALVLSGGDTDITQPLSEQDILNLEQQAFLQLVQQPGTFARLEHMLKTGKPLRN